MPTSVGPYELDEELGSGALGVTYRALDSRTHATVALKVVHRSLRPDDRATSRLRREARAASELEHPNIANVVEYGEADGDLYIASKFADGETLRTRLERGPCLSEAETHGIAVCVAHALNAADALRVVHRNLTPENIFLSDEGQLRLCDFALTQGLDSATPGGYGAFAGASIYAAPELRERRGDIRSDLYSLGAIMLEALTGWPRAQLHVNGNGHGNGNGNGKHAAAPKPPNFSQLSRTARTLAPVVQKLLKANPADRYANPAELLRALQSMGPLDPTPGASFGNAAPVVGNGSHSTQGPPPSVAGPSQTLTPDRSTDLSEAAPVPAVPAGRPRRGLSWLIGGRRAPRPSASLSATLMARLEEVLEDGALSVASEGAFFDAAGSLGIPSLEPYPGVEHRLKIGRANAGRLTVLDAAASRGRLDADELLYLETDCMLLRKVGGWESGGYDFPVVRGVRYRSSADELWPLSGLGTVADAGVLSVTSRRVVFNGASESHDSLYNRLVFLRIFTDGIGISVSNRLEIHYYQLSDESGETLAAVINAAIQQSPST